MEIIKRFFTWFSTTFQKQSRKGKLVMGCLSLAILFCICSVPIALLSPSTPTPDEASSLINSTSTQALVLNTAVLEPVNTTPAPIPSNTSESTNSPSPTDTPKPSPTIKPTSASTSASTLIVHYIDVGQGRLNSH